MTAVTPFIQTRIPGEPCRRQAIPQEGRTVSSPETLPSARRPYVRPYFKGLTPTTTPPEIPGFSAQDVARIHEVMAPCVYGRNLRAFFKPECGFQASLTPRRSVRLENFYYPDEADLHRGTCGELAHRIGESLQSDPVLREKYEFIYAIGSEPRYFPEFKAHTYLLAWPKDLKTFSPQGKPLPPREALKYAYSGEHPIPEGMVIIDPSYRTLGVPGRDPSVAGYKVQTVREIDEIEIPPKSHEMWIKESRKTSDSILGFVKDWAPEVSDGEGEDRLLHFHIELPPGGRPVCHLTSQRSGGEIEPADDLLASLPNENIIKRFFSLVEAQLRQSSSR